MPFFSIIAKDRANSGRQNVRPKHLKHLESLGDKLVLAGPFQNEAGQSVGSFMVVEAPDLKAATALFEQDPFIREGVFASFEISRFSLTINHSAGR